MSAPLRDSSLVKAIGFSIAFGLLTANNLIADDTTPSVDPTGSPSGTPSGTPGAPGSAPGAPTTPSGTPTGTPSGSPSGPAGAPTLQSQRQVYESNLNPVNSTVSSATATAKLVVEGKQAGIIIQGSNFEPGMMHQQALYIGTQCPTLSNDKNGDGIIDITEASAVTGPPVFVLSFSPAATSATSSSNSAAVTMSGTFAVPNQNGSYIYIASFPLDTLLSALKISSTSGSNTPGLPTGLEGKVIQIHGVTSSTNLPSTVLGLAGGSAAESLPVACGTFTKSSEQ